MWTNPSLKPFLLMIVYDQPSPICAQHWHDSSNARFHSSREFLWHDMHLPCPLYLHHVKQHDLIPYFFLKKPVLFYHLGTFSHYVVPNGSLDVCVCAKDEARICVCACCLRVIHCSTEILYCFVCRPQVYSCSVIDNIIVKLITQILSDCISVSVDVPWLTRFNEVEVGLMIFVQIFHRNILLHSN